MTTGGAKKQLSKAFQEEDGFTLPEMMVTIMIMIVVLFALYSIFDMSLRVFAYGNDKIEATENARVALERMEREIRAAYPHNPNPTVGTPDERRLDPSVSNATQITFWNDLNGNGNGNDANLGETISFSLDVDNNNLVRSQSGATGTTTETLTTLGPGGALEFKYFDKTTGADITTPSAANEIDIGMVRIKLEVVEDGANQAANQELITNVSLRNRGE